MKDIEELRGQKFLRPVQTRLADRETFVSHAKHRLESLVPPEQLEGAEEMAKMLSLVPAEMDLMAKTFEILEDQVGGFYSPEEDTFYLMESFTGAMAEIILAHELTHALDDQLFDIDDDLRALIHDSDASTAYSAVVEGSGTSAMNQWTVEHIKELDMNPEEMQQAQTMGMESLRDAPAYLWLPLISAYLRGASFLARSESMMTGQMRSVPFSDIERAFTDPPRSTEQILHPDKYWDKGQRDDPRKISFDTSDLPSGWSLMYEDTLGEMLIALLTTLVEDRTGFDVENPVAVLGLKYTNAVAEGWGGDRLVLLERGNARFLQLVTLWDTPKDAAEFFGAMQVLKSRLEENLRQFALALESGTTEATETEGEMATEAESPKPTQVQVEVGYASSRSEVVLQLSFGARRSKLRALRKALTWEELESSEEER